MEYLKVWTSFAEVLEPLTDEERGRLFMAMLRYAEDGTLPEFTGNERFIWPSARQTIERAADAASVFRQNGMKGGRPKTKQNQTEPNVTKQNQTKPNETAENQTEPDETLKKSNNKEKKDKEILTDDDNARVRESDVGEVELDPVIVTVQQELYGMAYSHYDELESYRKDLPDELIIEAVNEAVAHGNRTWAYVRKVLNNYLKDGIRTVGEARAKSEGYRQKTGGPADRGPKIVSAQRYEQRNYSEEDLEKVQDDPVLMALEAKESGQEFDWKRAIRA